MCGTIYHHLLILCFDKQASDNLTCKSAKIDSDKPHMKTRVSSLSVRNYMYYYFDKLLELFLLILLYMVIFFCRSGHAERAF